MDEFKITINAFYTKSGEFKKINDEDDIEI